MGTNYYWYKLSPCECCGRPYEPLHIGKSSSGWVFSLHVIPKDHINDLNDWEVLWECLGSVIKDEYGQEISSNEMKEIICNRSCSSPSSPIPPDQYRRNFAVPGPNNLFRHHLSLNCIKHGKGTWDCIIGNFS